FSSRNRRRIAAAAAILLVGAFLALIGPRLLSEHESPASEGQTLSAVTGLSEPAEAYIKLDDGQVIALNSRVSGNIYSDKVTSINKIGGRLSYDPVSQRGYSAGISEEVPQYHTVVIPKGQQYELILPDGTHVWLNSLSSITFPVRFSRADRTVEITGEAYFEVVHEAERPFLVTAGEQQVKVLGTRFNINAYDDEEIIRTTLVEGKVEVRVPSAGYQPDREIVRVLHPCQQSRFSSDAGRLNVVAVDVHNAIAWKGGLILFEGASIESILRQVSRWYD